MSGKVEEKQIYVSFDKPYYKLNKAELLKAHLDMLNLQKRMNHLKAIRANKKRYLAELNKKFSNMEVVLEKLDSKMPEAGLPKHIKAKVKVRKIKTTHSAPILKGTKEKKIKKEETFSNLDQELLNIQERLKKLNS